MAGLRFVIALVVLAVVFGLVERRWPASTSRRARWGLDVGWWVLGRVVDPLVKAVVGLLLVGPLVLAGLPLERELLLQGHGWVATLPAPLQLVGALFVADGCATLLHHVHHRWRPMWRVHTVHHSSTHLDWLAAGRVHPLNEVAQRAPGALVLLLLGFDLTVVAAVAPILTLWAVGLHANVDWRLGPLRYVVATPAFHRWHHAHPPADRPHGCNFAGLFPVFDLILGSYYLPPEPATSFGVVDLDVPERLGAQLLLRFPPRA